MLTKLYLIARYSKIIDGVVGGHRIPEATQSRVTVLASIEFVVPLLLDHGAPQQQIALGLVVREISYRVLHAFFKTQGLCVCCVIFWVLERLFMSLIDQCFSFL